VFYTHLQSSAPASQLTVRGNSSDTGLESRAPCFLAVTRITYCCGAVQLKPISLRQALQLRQGSRVYALTPSGPIALVTPLAVPGCRLPCLCDLSTSRSAVVTCAGAAEQDGELAGSNIGRDLEAACTTLASVVCWCFDGEGCCVDLRLAKRRLAFCLRWLFHWGFQMGVDCLSQSFASSQSSPVTILVCALAHAYTPTTPST